MPLEGSPESGIVTRREFCYFTIDIEGESKSEPEVIRVAVNTRRSESKTLVLHLRSGHNGIRIQQIPQHYKISQCVNPC